MVNSLLALINQEGSLGFGEACIYGLIGYLMVFIGIAIIILIIWLIGLLMRKTNNLEFLFKKGKGKNKNKQSVQVTTEAESEEDDGEIPDEVKAAIIAAIMAYYVNEKPECDFKVKRIKRI